MSRLFSQGVTPWRKFPDGLPGGIVRGGELAPFPVLVLYSDGVTRDGLAKHGKLIEPAGQWKPTAWRPKYSAAEMLEIFEARPEEGGGPL